MKKQRLVKVRIRKRPTIAYVNLGQRSTDRDLKQKTTKGVSVNQILANDNDKSQITAQVCLIEKTANGDTRQRYLGAAKE